MLKSSLLILLALCIAVVGGAASAWYALREEQGLGAVMVGEWTTFPDLGTPDSDPYSRARVARAGELTLGRAEGLAFVAHRDSAGRPLRRECGYKVEGQFPAARFWTIYAAGEDLHVMRWGDVRAFAIYSNDALRAADNSVRLSVGPRPSPGNWLRTSGTGPLALVLTLYDTPVGSASGIAEIQLPQVSSTGCDA